MGKEEENSVEKLLKGKNQEIKNLQARIKKLMNNVKENELEIFLIVRSKSPQEIENQINRLPDKFNEIEKTDGPVREKEEYYDIEDSEENHLKLKTQLKIYLHQERIRKERKEERKRNI